MPIYNIVSVTPPVNTGAALWYVYHNVSGQEGDRPDVRNVLVIDTNENSDDDVIAASRALRRAGVLVSSTPILTKASLSDHSPEGVIVFTHNCFFWLFFKCFFILRT